MQFKQTKSIFVVAALTNTTQQNILPQQFYQQSRDSQQPDTPDTQDFNQKVLGRNFAFATNKQ